MIMTQFQTKLLQQRGHSLSQVFDNKTTITLRDLYQDKCAFCECKFTEADGQLKHAFVGKRP